MLQNEPSPSLPAASAQTLQPLQLSYGPPERSRWRLGWVIASGLITTALTLALDYYLSRWGKTYVMGWYADYVIPAGAIVLGLGASSGYALASLHQGVRIRRTLLWTIVVLMFMSYFAARYIEFRARGPLVVQTGFRTVVTRSGARTSSKQVPILRPLGFWYHFHLQTVNFRWKDKESNQPAGEPLGMAGYFFVGIAILGFSFSGLILPVALGKRPYCNLCQRYMKIRKIARMPGSMPAKKFSKSRAADKAKYQLQHQQQFKSSMQQIERMTSAARAGDIDGFTAISKEQTMPALKVHKLPRQILIRFIACESCKSGRLAISNITGRGNKARQTPLSSLDLDRTFVTAMLEKQGR